MRNHTIPNGMDRFFDGFPGSELPGYVHEVPTEQNPTGFFGTKVR